jgi:hypothetical protein
MSKLELPDHEIEWVQRISPTYKFACAVLFLVLCLTFVVPAWSASEQSSSKTIGSLGTVTSSSGHMPPGLTLRYSTDFETVTISGDHLTISVDNYLETDGSYSTNYWMEGHDRTTPGFTPHGGSRCLGMARPGNSRTEFKIWHEWAWGLSNTWYIKLWEYYPSDFTVKSEGELIFSFGDASYPPGYPWIGHYLFPTSDPAVFRIRCGCSGFDNSYNGEIGPSRTFTLPRGQWSLWEYCLDRGTADVANGRLQVWVNGNLAIDSGNILPCKKSSNSGNTIEVYPTDLYNWGQGGSEQRWIDDLEIWG